jgi:hypothetical protein
MRWRISPRFQPTRLAIRSSSLRVSLSISAEPGAGKSSDPPAWSRRPNTPGPKNLLELGEERYDAPRGLSLEPAELVGAEGDRLTIEAHIIELEAKHFPVP